MVLQVLHEIEYIICEGTFEMSPSTAYKVYTIHRYCHGEGMPLCWALLPNKTTSTYTEMFQVIRGGTGSAVRFGRCDENIHH